MIPGINRLTILLMAVMLNACDKPGLVLQQKPYRFQVPAHFPEPVFDTENPMSQAGVQLGRMLFYDKRLSANNQVSCASCHDPKLAFSDGVKLSHAGVSATALHRHSQALFNLAWANNGLFWDGGATNLESQAFAPLTAHDEMAQDLDQLIIELSAVPAYVSSFQQAFNEPANAQNAAKALAQFERSLVSAGSKYDRYRLKIKGETLTDDESKGRELVRQKCQGCHAGELFTDQSFHNNGIDSDFSNSEHEGIYQGRYRITYDSVDLGKFKTPSLRNVVLTAPYMHDGCFATLEEVVEHYSTGIKGSVTLSSLLPEGGLNLSEQEKKQMIAFLHTLTDHSLIENPDHGKPSDH
ncbi:cytochrome-c peroxidase [Dyadobacter sp. LJ53]|uniref:cytochrome-c peroxidase n=1 Tax=Dyadobacter chenwenxiniae TaxID=2906456 RepID=UPI001F347C46|nr:cytochrome c peroxidase [Dyadobacter chenwenxiniae]MCF0048989.1 cytochrome-c peroxidase [Dyadobacter chenwenxiniae]